MTDETREETREETGRGIAMTVLVKVGDIETEREEEIMLMKERTETKGGEMIGTCPLVPLILIPVMTREREREMMRQQRANQPSRK